MSSVSDNKWLHKLAAGDQTAYASLFDAMYLPLLRVATRMTDATAGEDIVHDVLMSMWKKRERFTSIAELKAYLYKSVHNKAIDHMRSHKLRQEHLTKFLEKTFYEAVLDEEVYEELRAAIDVLPEHYRRVIELTLDGYRADDIAAMLGTTADAVKAYKKRAKGILKERLDKSLFIIPLI